MQELKNNIILTFNVKDKAVTNEIEVKTKKKRSLSLFCCKRKVQKTFEGTEYLDTTQKCQPDFSS